MKIRLLSLLIIAITISVNAQVAPDKYFVKFTDKNNSPYSIDNPSQYLSQRAIQRRDHQDIAIDQTDLPVNPSYLQGVAATGATILNPTKWLNGVTIYTTDPSVLQAINDLPYVEGVTKFPVPNSSDIRKDSDTDKPFFSHELYNQPVIPSTKQGNELETYDYGSGYNQIHMLNGDAMHDMGYRGQGMIIAVLDAGFLNVNVHAAFDSLWQNNQILGTHDFVAGGPILFDGHPHGAMVLSCMGGNYPGMLIGTAPKASFYLLRSEDGGSEYLIEEYNWVSAAEYADSVGADVINSSLGYNEFLDTTTNHTYADMDGNTCPATIGADFAAKKGILVVVSLGNEGSSSWYYLSSPSDGDSVMGIGAVDAQGNYASFSSHGPSYDGRVKPDVAAQGANVCIADPYSNGNFSLGSGTSFSSPIMAGMSTCLWQANPSMTNMQVADAIRKSASQYLAPDAFLGYGIPDFIEANNILTVVSEPGKDEFVVNVYPNPCKGTFYLEAGKQGSGETGNEEQLIELSDLTGRMIGTRTVDLYKSQKISVDILKNAPKGIYFLKVSSGKVNSTMKIVKE
jgi:serine protease AprX